MTITLDGATLSRAEDEQLFFNSVYEFADREIRPYVREMDEQAKLRPELIPALFDLGVMGDRGAAGVSGRRRVVLPCGAGRGSLVARRSLGRRFCGRAEHPVHQRPPSLGHGRPAPPLLSADGHAQRGAYALSEAGSGSDAFAMASRAQQVGDEFVLTGRKLWITNANEADIFIVFANANPEAGYRGITAFLIERGFPGFAVGKKEDKLGIRASSTCEVLLEECRVPRSNVLGEVGKGYKVAMETLNEGRIGIGAQMVGTAQGALDHALKYVRERKQFGRPIAEFQAVQHQLARAATELEAARLMVYQAARRRDAGQSFLTQAAMCKLFSSEVAERVTSLAVNLFGGYGYVKDYPVEKLWRDQKIGQIYEGTSNLQLQTIAKQILS